mgnify:CR=1 FL=1
MDHESRAVELYNQGCNCAQAVFCAFAEEEGMDLKASSPLASSFGGGMGHLGETCGALTGLFMAMGQRYGFEPSDPKETKDQFYAEIKALGEAFRVSKGAIRCDELLERHKDLPRPEVNGKPVKKCEHLVRDAVRLGELYLQTKETQSKF